MSSENIKNEKRKKSQSVTHEQKKAMIDFLNNHPNLMKGKHTVTFTQEIARQQWEAQQQF